MQEDERKMESGNVCNDQMEGCMLLFVIRSVRTPFWEWEDFKVFGFLYSLKRSSETAACRGLASPKSCRCLLSFFLHHKYTCLVLLGLVEFITAPLLSTYFYSFLPLRTNNVCAKINKENKSEAKICELSDNDEGIRKDEASFRLKSVKWSSL